MKTVEEIKAAIEAAVPGAGVEFVPNPRPAAEHSLRLAPASAVAVATFLRDDADLAFDFLSNVSGVDWPDKEIAEKVKVTAHGDEDRGRPEGKPEGKIDKQVEETVEETRKRVEPGCLEAVYHLYSVAKKHGPLVLRMKTVNRTDQVELPSLTPVWRSAEFQEREVFDLYGIVFHRPSGPAPHPDVGWIQGPPHAQGLRGAGRLRVRAHAARRRAGAGARAQKQGTGNQATREQESGIA